MYSMVTMVNDVVYLKVVKRVNLYSSFKKKSSRMCRSHSNKLVDCYYLAGVV